MDSPILLLIIMCLGFLAHSRVVVLASISLLLLKELKADSFFTVLSNRGIEVGLVFLMLAILSSLLLSPVDWKELKLTFVSKEGIIAIIAGLLATRFNGLGLSLLNNSPHIIIGIIVGSFIGITFFGGIPVGPLMAAGIAALFLKLFEIIA